MIGHQINPQNNINNKSICINIYRSLGQAELGDTVRVRLISFLRSIWQHECIKFCVLVIAVVILVPGVILTPFYFAFWYIDSIGKCKLSCKIFLI